MDNKSAIKAEAAPSVIKDTTTTKDDLEKQNRDRTTDKKISDAMKIIAGFGVRLHHIEEKVNKIEEKMDLVISLIRSNNEDGIGSVKAEEENMYMDESYSDEQPVQKEFINPFNRVHGGGPSDLFVGGRFSGGRCGGQGFCSFC